ncbi:riboflavin biosynthesis pyrimidine reductase [Diaminobutyricimonas aerilata]|uniref:Riboflavin biosynthesis pyrimidine reductase n=1 Tax=Diaminobutyricimonas aerilata TaxID=1162967 RepID=A0A2M9CKC2_9MICO|nr:dihydrofolate reductase family protein [Diaminobutyricimonas aerilata]PJJ72344.1 riboflavin biosynthesis pyrimidine reductase [Diaminobutyricimonas aerilata]
MILRRLLPDAGELDIADTAGRDALLREYAPPPGAHLRLNMIASLDGSAVGDDGTSESLSNRVDRRILGVIRELADAVIVGAASVRAEGYQIPRASRLAVVTATGDLGGHRFERAAEPVLVLGPAHAVARAADELGDLIEAVPLPDGSGPSAILDALHGRGLRSLVSEGGPTLARRLLEHGLVDEFCLSWSPRLVGARLPLVGAGALDPVTLRPIALFSDDEGSLYGRWIPAGA